MHATVPSSHFLDQEGRAVHLQLRIEEIVLIVEVIRL